MTVILPQGSAPDNLERRLRGEAGLDGKRGPPTVGEIMAAVAGTTGGDAARLKGWAADALRRIGANALAREMGRAAEAASRGVPAPPVGLGQAVAAEDAQAYLDGLT